MNTENIKAAHEVRSLVIGQGWTEPTELRVLYDFFYSKGLYPQLLEYMKERIEH